MKKFFFVNFLIIFVVLAGIKSIDGSKPHRQIVRKDSSNENSDENESTGLFTEFMDGLNYAFEALGTFEFPGDNDDDDNSTENGTNDKLEDNFDVFGIIEFSDDSDDNDDSEENDITENTSPRVTSTSASSVMNETVTKSPLTTRTTEKIDENEITSTPQNDSFTSRRNQTTRNSFP